MVDNNSIMAHYDAGNKGEETISSSYLYLLLESVIAGAVMVSVTSVAAERVIAHCTRTLKRIVKPG